MASSDWNPHGPLILKAVASQQRRVCPLEPDCLGSSPSPGTNSSVWPWASYLTCALVSSSVKEDHRNTYLKVLARSCLTLCDPMDCSPPGSSVHGILQAGILEWVAIPFSRGFFQPRD